MNLAEYERVKDLTYLKYCDYLQEKYGIGLHDYMTKSWIKTQDVQELRKGLFYTINMKITP